MINNREIGPSRDNMRELFGGIKPSRGARELVKEAIGLGLDPSGITQEAGAAAKEQGRKKAGNFGDSSELMSSLRNAIEATRVSRFRQRMTNPTDKR